MQKRKQSKKMQLLLRTMYSQGNLLRLYRVSSAQEAAARMLFPEGRGKYI
jgi:predicted RNA-binding protein YlxR (DUF448 family)